jgi:hypothetical protein
LVEEEEVEVARLGSRPPIAVGLCREEVVV